VKILLTGATGLVGSAVLDLLKQQAGFEVYGVSRQAPHLPGVNWIAADLNDPAQAIDQITRVGDVDALIHNAASLKGGATLEPIQEVVDVNVEFTKRLFEWADHHVSRCLLYTSSLSSIKKPLPEVVLETSNTAANSVYSESKLAGERLAERVRTRAVSLRISSPVGDQLDSMHRNVVRNWIEAARRGDGLRVFGRGERRQDFVSTHDVATAMLQCIERDSARGVYNTASGNTLSMLELAELISMRFEVPVECGGEDPLENEAWNISIEKARNDFGYAPSFTSRSAIENLLRSVS
jgi:UDP-glucose 4-epimerase